ncbi:MAG: hypothetical protein GX552_05900 [Chloroflexi bacterium]|nr:hypothetical protein [Chloroflexota bacterium]
MSNNKRAIIVLVVLVGIGVVFAVQGLLRQAAPAVPSATPQPGMIHFYVDGVFVANVAPGDVTSLPQASFVDSEEGKTQEGPLVKDLVLLYMKESDLSPQSVIRVEGRRSSSGEAKQGSVTWEQAQNPDNHLLFDISSSGDSLKLVSTLPEMGTRDTWVQGVSRIEVTTKP